MTVVSKRYEFVIYFDVTNNNPNGDPSLDGEVRQDPETGHGLVTDVALKRRIKDFISHVKSGQSGFDMYYKSGKSSNKRAKKILAMLGLNYEKSLQRKHYRDLLHEKEKDPDFENKIKNVSCRTYYDIRTFGAVMPTFVMAGLNCGQVQGPVQLTFARSVDEIIQNETITYKEIMKKDGAEEENHEMERKCIIPYALYRCEGFISAHQAKKTGFSEEDLELLWEGILHMFDDKSRQKNVGMNLRSFIVFEHSTKQGDIASHKLFEAVSTRKKEGIEYPREFTDYEPITIDRTGFPEGLKVKVFDL